MRNPVVYLMDEPLSNLDAQLRIQTRAELKRLQQELGTTTLYVTHDQGEAMTMGARVAVLRAGVIEQVGRPLDLYREPANRFVATFVGSPAINVWPGARDGIEIGVRAEDVQRLAGRGGGVDRGPGPGGRADGERDDPDPRRRRPARRGPHRRPISSCRRGRRPGSP